MLNATLSVIVAVTGSSTRRLCPREPATICIYKIILCTSEWMYLVLNATLSVMVEVVGSSTRRLCPREPAASGRPLSVIADGV